MHEISRTLCQAYNFLNKNGNISFPLTQEQGNHLDSIVKTVIGEWYGHIRFPPHQIRASAFFCYIIKDHPVIDGNKRLAVLWLQIYCDENNLKISNLALLDEIAIAIEQSKLDMENKSI